MSAASCRSEKLMAVGQAEREAGAAALITARIPSLAFVNLNSLAHLGHGLACISNSV